MTNRLFDDDGDLVAVIRDGTPAGDEAGKWAIGNDFQAAEGANQLTVSDYCDVVDIGQVVAGPSSETNPNVYTPLAFSANIRTFRNVRCAMGVELSLVQASLVNGGAVSAAEYVLWNGISTWGAAQPSLQNGDVSSLSSGTSAVADIVSAVINRYSGLTTEQRYILHLGVQAAIELSAAGYAYSNGPDDILKLRATDQPVVVSPYYPPKGVAVTGPIVVRLGIPEAFQVYDQNVNRTRIWGYQLMALEFDPSTAVRAT